MTREPEWDADERDIMRARQALELDRCGGCGGWLSETLTDKEPIDDDPDHYYRIEALWCRKCIAHDQWRQANEQGDREVEGTPADHRVHARRIVSEAVPPSRST